MPTAKLRQDTVRTFAYVGERNSQCIYICGKFTGQPLKDLRSA